MSISMVRSILCGTLALFALGSPAATAQDASKLVRKDGKPLTIGFSQIGAESAWRTAETRSIQKEAQRRGVDFKLADAQGKQANQIRAVRSLVRRTARRRDHHRPGRRDRLGPRAGRGAARRRAGLPGRPRRHRP